MSVVEDSVLVEVFLPVALAIVMVGIGLTLTIDDFKAQSRSKLALALGVLGQCVLVPAFAYVIAQLFNASPAISVGIVLVACTPGGATSNLLTYLGRGNVALGIVLTVFTSFVAIVTLPIWVDRALGTWAEGFEGGRVSVPIGEVLELLLFIIFVPIVIGVTIKRMLPSVAARLERFVSVFSLLVVLFLIVGILVDLGSAAGPLLRDAGPKSLIVASGAVAIGFLLGALGRLPRKDTIAIVCELGIKNITLGILIGLTVLQNEEVALPSAVYGLIMYIPSAVAVMIGRRWIPAPDKATSDS